MSTEVKLPTKFDDLQPSELYRSALEDFALPVEEADKNKKKVLLAAFVEGGVEWADYVAQHPEVAPEPVEPEVVAEVAPVVQPVVELAPEDIIVAKPVVSAPQGVYLIKMVRDNPAFHVKGKKFTQEHPYAIVNAELAEYLLTKEEGFRQATPSELAEFYG